MSDDQDSTQGPEEDSQGEGRDTQDVADEAMEAILRDPRRKAALLQRMGLEDAQSER